MKPTHEIPTKLIVKESNNNKNNNKNTSNYFNNDLYFINESNQKQLGTHLKNKIHCFSFNQDASCLCIGIDQGFKIFSTKPFRESIDRPNIVEKNEYLKQIQLNKRSNIIAFVVTNKEIEEKLLLNKKNEELINKRKENINNDDNEDNNGNKNHDSDNEEYQKNGKRKTENKGFFARLLSKFYKAKASKQKSKRKNCKYYDTNKSNNTKSTLLLKRAFSNKFFNKYNNNVKSDYYNKQNNISNNWNLSNTQTTPFIRNLSIPYTYEHKKKRFENKYDFINNIPNYNLYNDKKITNFNNPYYNNDFDGSGNHNISYIRNNQKHLTSHSTKFFNEKNIEKSRRVTDSFGKNKFSKYNNTGHKNHYKYDNNKSIKKSNTPKNNYYSNFNLFKNKENNEDGINIEDAGNDSNNNNNKKQNHLNKVVVWDDYHAKVILELRIHNEIYDLTMQNEFLFIITINKIFVFNYRELRLQEVVDTYLNPDGAFSVSNSNKTFLNNNYMLKNKNRVILVYPDLTLGYAHLINLHTKSYLKINAHDDVINKLALNITGDLLASASKNGRVVRIFSCKSGVILQELRRGTEKADVYRLAFSNDSKFLALTSNKTTVHLFSLRNSYYKLIDNKEHIDFKSFLSCCNYDDLNLQTSNVGVFLNIVSQNNEVYDAVMKLSLPKLDSESKQNNSKNKVVNSNTSRNRSRNYNNNSSNIPYTTAINANNYNSRLNLNNNKSVNFNTFSKTNSALNTYNLKSSKSNDHIKTLSTTKVINTPNNTNNIYNNISFNSEDDDLSENKEETFQDNPFMLLDSLNESESIFLMEDYFMSLPKNQKSL